MNDFAGSLRGMPTLPSSSSSLLVRTDFTSDDEPLTGIFLIPGRCGTLMSSGDHRVGEDPRKWGKYRSWVMDPVTVGTVLAAVAGGAGGALGSQAWNAVCTLIRRSFHRDEAGGGSSAEVSLAALTEAPGDVRRGTELARVLIEQVDMDDEFARNLAAWWTQAREVRTGGDVSNVISGGIQCGPVAQGRDFGSLTFVSPTGPAPGK
jgi:hypothetical protein